jgi:HPt (histidine-containing phosphotransfer) domain-containing protein
MATEVDPREVEFQAQVEALRLHFLQGLPERRGALAAAWRDCADGGDESAWQRLRDVAHKLSGSAPCYGLNPVGESARALDGLLSARPPRRERAAVAAAVAELAAALEAAIAPP